MRIGKVYFEKYFRRLNTIADYDKVMVIDEGRVAEMGRPIDLLTNDPINSDKIDKDTLFSKLVLNTGERNSQAIFNLAKY